MKSICVCLVLVVFGACETFAVNPKLAVESTQTTASAVKPKSESFGNVYEEKGEWTWAGDRNKVYAQLEVSVPKVELTFFDEYYSVGGEDVCIRVQLVDDNYFSNKGTKGSWVCSDSEIKIRKSDYLEIKKNGTSASFKTEGDLWKTLRHEAVHASFSQKYPSLRSKDRGLNSFVTEMLAYVGGTGLNEYEAATHIAKHYPFAKAFAERYLAELDRRQCEKPTKIFDNATTLSLNDLKNMDLDNKNGDWCKCDPPGCINKVKIVKGKHVGFITFECSYCKKINVAFAKAALEFGRVVESEGGDIQWYGANAEERANSAAGNVK